MHVPDWVMQLWEELRFMELVAQESGEGFQRLFQRVMKSVEGDAFLDIRPIGRHGDRKCDGWSINSQTCYAAYGPFAKKNQNQVRRKIESDLRGAAEAWPEMRGWRLVHNDRNGISALVASALISLQAESSSALPNAAILPPWGPKDLWWLLRQAPREARESVLGFPPWNLAPSQVEGFTGVGDDPVSVSAGRSVAQLISGFAAGGIADPVAATAFAGALTMFFLGDKATVKLYMARLEERCREDPFEAMLTSVIFCVLAVQLWEAATGESTQFWRNMMSSSGLSIDFILDIAVSARSGNVDDVAPGHPEDQSKIAMNLGQVTALTVQLTADARSDAVVLTLQDLLIGVQRYPGRPHFAR
ncbi:MAG: hypothetical protein JWM19_81 [Actinomycetia bacterium]|nr:hypothetical protein [Actinomycetes bacterium]